MGIVREKPRECALKQIHAFWHLRSHFAQGGRKFGGSSPAPGGFHPLQPPSTCPRASPSPELLLENPGQASQTCREAIWIPRWDNFSRGFLLRQCWYNTSSPKTLLPAALQLSLLNPHHCHLAFYFSPPSLPVINRCDVISGLLLASPGAPR